MSLASWLVRRYPRAWRRRYEAEMLAVLEQHHVTIVTVLDLFFGVITARLDPRFRSESRLMRFSSPRKATWLFLTAVGSFVLLVQTAEGAIEGGIQAVFAGQSTYPVSCSAYVPDVPFLYWVNQLGTESIFCNRPPILPVVYLLVSTLVVGGSLYWAITGRHWEVLVLAVTCFVVPVVASVWLDQQPVVQRDMYEITTPLGVLSLLGALEAPMGVVILSMVRGTQAITTRRYRLFGLVLAIDLSLVVVFLTLANTSRAFTLSGSPVIREFGFYSGTLGVAALLLPFATIGMTLLAIAGSDISKRGWPLVLGGASLLTCVMVFYLVFFIVGLSSDWQDYTRSSFWPGVVIGAGLLLLSLLAILALRGMVRAVLSSSSATDVAA
jgi:hypothetical protein